MWLMLTLIMAAAQNRDGAGGKMSDGSLIVIVFTRTTGWISIWGQTFDKKHPLNFIAYPDIGPSLGISLYSLSNFTMTEGHPTYRNWSRSIAQSGCMLFMSSSEPCMIPTWSGPPVSGRWKQRWRPSGPAGCHSQKYSRWRQQSLHHTPGWSLCFGQRCSWLSVEERRWAILCTLWPACRTIKMCPDHAIIGTLRGHVWWIYLY